MMTTYRCKKCGMACLFMTTALLCEFTHDIGETLKEYKDEQKDAN